MVKKRENPWLGVAGDLFARLCNAFKSIPFIAFFLVGVVFIGGIGVWLPYSLDKSSSKVLFESQNVLTFYIAILGTLSIDVIISKNRNINLAALGYIFGIGALILGVYGYFHHPKGVVWQVNLGAILTLIVFIFATVNDDKFDEHKPVIADSTGYQDADKDYIKDKS